MEQKIIYCFNNSIIILKGLLIKVIFQRRKDCLKKLLTLFKMGLPWPAHGCLHISYNNENWHSYILPKENPKTI